MRPDTAGKLTAFPKLMGGEVERGRGRGKGEKETEWVGKEEEEEVF